MENKGLVSPLLLGALIIFVALLAYVNEFEAYEVQKQVQLKRFSSYEELRAFVTAKWSPPPYYNAEEDGRFALQPSVLTGTITESTKASAVPEYFTTNIQVEGVDEVDIVKTDGEFIYVGSGKEIFILKAYPAEEAEILSLIALNGTLEGIFIEEDRLVILEKSGFHGMAKTSVKIYDVSNRGEPVLKRKISVDGYYFNSRLTENHVYLLVNKPVYSGENNVSLPKIYVDNRTVEIPASAVYYSDLPDTYHVYTTIIAINLQSDEEEPTFEAFLLGGTRNLYVSLNNIYVTLPKTSSLYALPWQKAPAVKAQRTVIHRVSIEKGDIEYVASGEVPGYVLNQFSMDEHNGYFRIATTTRHVDWATKKVTSSNHIFVLDMNLNIVGKLENLAPGERIYSARFLGDRCYLVTFKKVDPLFVVDLENPIAPRVLGELKITGYSDYLHPYDEKHLIGIGKETIAAEEGDFAWYQGVKISLFDVSNVSEPKEIAKYEIGDRGTESPVLKDHKALLFDKAKSLLVLPVLVAEIEENHPYGVPPWVRGDYVWQGAYVFEVSPEKGLIHKGKITHLENSVNPETGYHFSFSYAVKRSLYIDNVLYTISDKKVKMNNLESLLEINEIRFP
jgi:uncharacterized secreted protein with C-terminal beta-propeller domain